MKREKNLDGYRTHVLNVRLTESEYLKFKDLLKKTEVDKEAKLLASDFIRQQLLYENDQIKINQIYNQIRKIRMELRQALIRYEKLNDEKSLGYLKEILEGSCEKVSEIKNIMEDMYYGSNSTEEHKG